MNPRNNPYPEAIYPNQTQRGGYPLPDPNATHHIEGDTAGFGQHSRIQCVPCLANPNTWQRATLVRQPYMTTAIWTARLTDFLAEHPDDCNPGHPAEQTDDFAQPKGDNDQ